jgi:hypothetical protein
MICPSVLKPLKHRKAAQLLYVKMDRELEIETYVDASKPPPRMYSVSDDPYAMGAAEEQKVPAKYTPLKSQEASDDVKVSVSDPVIKEETLSKHVVYTIRVTSRQGSDLHGSFEAQRRYSEFLLVRRRLIERWPGCYVPPIPPKQFMVKEK